MKWTKERPECDGYYWLKCKYFKKYRVLVSCPAHFIIVTKVNSKHKSIPIFGSVFMTDLIDNFKCKWSLIEELK